jgi:hypothetical protein
VELGVQNAYPSEVAVSDDPYIKGEFGSGAFGPTIFMVLSSRSTARWLGTLFRSMAQSGAMIDLAACDGVELYNIEALQLIRVAARRGPQLSKARRRNAFLWQCDDEEWETNAQLVDPFAAGNSGHQYFTRSGVDDAVVEISFGEPEVRVPGT